MLLDYKLSQGSVVLRVKIRNSSVSTGAGLTGLTNASAGLIISTIADNEAAATAYTQAGGTIDTIATLGTFATPTATHCRFKEVDATNHKGIYEIQIDNARFAVASSKSLLISISGATNAAECDVVIPLRAVDPYDSIRFGLSALPAFAANANGGLPILSVAGTTLGYTITTLTTYTGNTVQTGDAFARLGAPAGASIAADLAEIEAETDAIAAIPTSNPSASAIATAVWQDLTASADFTTAASIGKLLATMSFTGAGNIKADVEQILGTTSTGVAGYVGIDWSHVNAPTTAVNLSGTTISTVSGNVGGNVVGTVASVAGAVGSVTSPVTVGGYSANQDPETLVLNAAASSFNTAGTIGAKINSAASAGDPWATVLPGGYVANTAGNILGNRAGFLLAAAGLDSIFPESGVNARQALAVITSAVAGKLDGVGTGTQHTYAANNPATLRITYSTDTTGRTTVSYNLP